MKVYYPEIDKIPFGYPMKPIELVWDYFNESRPLFTSRDLRSSINKAAEVGGYFSSWVS